MESEITSIKGKYFIGLYLVLIILPLLELESVPYLSLVASALCIPALLIFFYLNTLIDSKFEKHIFYGLILFTIINILPIIYEQIKSFYIYLVLALQMIAYFNYAKAFMSITNVRTSILYQKKWILVVVGLIWLSTLGAILINSNTSGILLFPMICFGIVLFFFLLSGINLYEQVFGVLFRYLMSGVIVLMIFNCAEGLIYQENIDIFNLGLKAIFFAGHLLLILGAIKASITFRNNTHDSISDVFKKQVK